jgi:hypothetical protein
MFVMMARAVVRWWPILALFGAACREPTSIVRGPAAWDVVFRLPPGDIRTFGSSPDGALFVTTSSGAVYRALPGQDTRWSPIVAPAGPEPWVAQLYAPDARTFIGIGGSYIVRWDEGIGVREVPSPVRDSTVWCNDFVAGPRLAAVWGRSAHDVWIVSANGFVMHYDGVSWIVQSLVGGNAQDGWCWSSPEKPLVAIGGDADHVYVAGAGAAVLRTTDGTTWKRVPRPTGPETGGVLAAIATQPEGVLFAGGELQRIGNEPPYQFYFPARLLRLTPTGWEVDQNANDVLHLNGGGAQPGSSAVFWSFDNDVLVVDGRRVTPMRLSAFHQVRGAVAVGSTVYVAGFLDREDVVVRLKR